MGSVALSYRSWYRMSLSSSVRFVVIVDVVVCVLCVVLCCVVLCCVRFQNSVDFVDFLTAFSKVVSDEGSGFHSHHHENHFLLPKIDQK
jgi:hypothetical protein